MLMIKYVITSLLICLFILLIFGSSLFASQIDIASEEILSQRQGMSLDEFRTLWENEGRTPEGSVRCLLIAVLETVKENNKDGLKMWGMVIPKDDVTASGEPLPSIASFQLSQFARQVPGTSFRGGIAASYIGGCPANAYSYSYSNRVSVDEGSTRRKADEVKLFVKSGGKDNPSPVTLKKNKDGYWKIFNYSSLYTGVRPATAANDF